MGIEVVLVLPTRFTHFLTRYGSVGRLKTQTNKKLNNKPKCRSLFLSLTVNFLDRTMNINDEDQPINLEEIMNIDEKQFRKQMINWIESRDTNVSCIFS